MDRNATAARTVPLALESCRPVRQLMDLIEQHPRRAVFCALFRLRPLAFPEAGKCSIRIVAGSVNGLDAEFGGDLEKQGRLADLARPGEKLDASRSRFFKPIEQNFAAVGEGIRNLIYSRIIIRICTIQCQPPLRGSLVQCVSCARLHPFARACWRPFDPLLISRTLEIMTAWKVSAAVGNVRNNTSTLLKRMDGLSSASIRSVHDPVFRSGWARRLFARWPKAQVMRRTLPSRIPRKERNGVFPQVCWHGNRDRAAHFPWLLYFSDCNGFSGAPGEIRTPDLLIRSPFRAACTDMLRSATIYLTSSPS